MCLGQWKFEQKHYCLFTTECHLFIMVPSLWSSPLKQHPLQAWLTIIGQRLKMGVLLEWLEGSEEIHTACMHTNPQSNHTHHALSCEHENICERSTYGMLPAEGWGICRCLFEEPCWGCWHTDHDNRASLLSFPLIRWLFDDWPARQRLQVQKQRRLVGSAGAGAVKGQSRSVRSETHFYKYLIWEGTLCDSAVCGSALITFLSH